MAFLSEKKEQFFIYILPCGCVELVYLVLSNSPAGMPIIRPPPKSKKVSNSDGALIAAKPGQHKITARAQKHLVFIRRIPKTINSW